MIGNGIPWGQGRYTIIEEGELQRDTFRLQVQHYLVAGPDGLPLDRRFATQEEAGRFIEALERAEGEGKSR